MKRHLISYYFAEGFRGIFLHGVMSFAAIGVIVACLLIMGSFSLIALNLQANVTELEQKNELTVYVSDALDDAEARSLSSRINVLDNVRRCEFVTSEEIFQSYVDELGAEVMSGVDSHIFPNRYLVYLQDIAYAKDTIAVISAISGVDEVIGSEDLMQTLLSLRRIVQVVSLVLIVVLFIVSLFIMSNTIKLATFDRREEIAIMRIVGATKSFIRWPFVVEGFLMGLFAGLVGFLLQWLAYNQLTKQLLSGYEVLTIIPFDELLYPLLAVFAGMGFLVGIGGSVLTIRKFLRA